MSNDNYQNSGSMGDSEESINRSSQDPPFDPRSFEGLVAFYEERLKDESLSDELRRLIEAKLRQLQHPFFHLGDIDYLGF